MEGRENMIISIINIVLRDVSYKVVCEVVDLRNHNLRKYGAVLRARRDEGTWKNPLQKEVITFMLS